MQVIFNIGFIFIVAPIIHKRLLPTENWRWYIQDVGLPFAASMITVGIGRWFITDTMSKPVMMVSIMLISILTLGITAMATSTTRSWLLNSFLNMKIGFGLMGKNA